MINVKRVIFCAAALVVGAMGAFVLADAPTSAPASQPAEFRPAFAAMEYFDINCARCHGPQGSFYGKEFGKHLSDAALTQFVRMMAEGPGNAPLKPDELKVEVAYHRSLAKGELFLSITSNENGMLKGEVSPGSSVTVDGKPAQVEGLKWSAPAGIEIIAKREKKMTMLRLPQAFSHQQTIDAKK